MYKNLLYFILFTVFTSCTSKEKKSTSLFFAGEIVNPTSKYVVLHKDAVVIDSSKLDNNNRFSFSLNDITEGLYHFDHDPELQYVYLKQGDSLMIRLNTSDFDESLIFSGIGENVNNFLLELFLSYEQENALINSFYILDSEKFTSKIDSLKNIKLGLLKDLQTEEKFSEKSLEIINVNIDYNYYSFLEKYPFKHKQKTGKKQVEKLPENFYNYRRNLDFDKKGLTYYRPYYNFMKYHFGNLSYMNCRKKHESSNNFYKRQLHYNKHKLKLIDSLVVEQDLRDNLFRYFTMDYLLNTHDNNTNNEIIVNEFFKLSKNKKHISEINNLYKGIKKLQPNLDVPNITVYSAEGKKVFFKDICKDKNAVFYFWSGTQKRHFINVTKRIKTLNSKYIDYTFYGINIKTDVKRWLNMVDSQKLDRSKQYRAENFEDLTGKLVLNKLNKAIIIKDGIIVDAFADLYTSF